MTAEHESHGFTVVRVDRRGEFLPSYLRSFALAGRNGLRALAFGDRAVAHIFESRVDAEDIARRLRRRLSGTQYDYRIEEVVREAEAIPSEAKSTLGTHDSD